MGAFNILKRQSFKNLISDFWTNKFKILVSENLPNLGLQLTIILGINHSDNWSDTKFSLCVFVI